VSRVDWIALAVVAVAALNGLRSGLVVGAFSLAGIFGGAVIGARIAPQFLHGGAASPYTPLAALAGAVLLGGVVRGVAGMAGSMIRRSLFVLPPLRLLDSLGGLLLGGAAGLALVWVLGAAVLQLPGQTSLRRYAVESEIVQRLNEIVPPRKVLNALARIDPFPSIAGPAPPRQAVDPDVLRLPGVRRAYPSVVRVVGTACGLGVEGSGWVARPGLVVTAAHVVAGVRHPTVQRRGTGAALHARTVAFDRANDVAVLRVRGLRAPALRLAQPHEGRSVAILGFPENGPFDVRAARLGSTRTVITQDAYGRGPVQRPIVTLRGIVRPGNSGGPVVDARGRVVTTVFAATRGGLRGGYGVPNAVVERDLSRAGDRSVSTGACAG
jgi:S1-C subfamily serine protease